MGATAAQKRQVLECVSQAARYDVLEPEDIRKIQQICLAATERKIKEAEGETV